MSIDYAERARALVGTRFRAQGRGPDGLDCVGVILESFGIPASAVPSDYATRGDRLAEIRSTLDTFFRRVPAKQLRAGDAIHLLASSDQHHLAVRTDLGFVHAHAGLRRVVETPGLPDWPLLGAYRKRSR